MSPRLKSSRSLILSEERVRMDEDPAHAPVVVEVVPQPRYFEGVGWRVERLFYVKSNRMVSMR